MYVYILTKWTITWKGAPKFFMQFLLNALKNMGLASKTSSFKPLSCKWFCSLYIGRWGQSKRIDLIASITMFIWSNNKSSSSDSVDVISVSIFAISIHSINFSNQSSEYEFRMSAWQAPSILVPCERTVFRATVGVCTAIMEEVTPSRFKFQLSCTQRRRTETSGVAFEFAKFGLCQFWFSSFLGWEFMLAVSQSLISRTPYLPIGGPRLSQWAQN